MTEREREQGWMMESRDVADQDWRRVEARRRNWMWKREIIGFMTSIFGLKNVGFGNNFKYNNYKSKGDYWNVAKYVV